MMHLLLLVQLVAAMDSSLATAIHRRVAATDGAQVAVALIDLASGASYYRNADTLFHAASTMKVPVLITAVSHDGGIVYPPGRAPYVLVVLTRGVRDGRASAALIADTSRIVYHHLTPEPTPAR